MLNIHLNGDIIRCPDISAIQKRNFERKDANRICKYGIREDDCSAWQNSVKSWQGVKNNESINKFIPRTQRVCRCMLSGSINCPGHLKQTETGRKEKSFKIDNVNYRKLSSSAHYLVKKSQYKTLFFTLTFGKYKTKKEPDEKTHNECFSRFMENLNKNYNCAGYVAVRERGKNTGRLHYHCLCSIPFVEFSVINSAWNHSISDICYFSNNAFTTDRKTVFIRNPVRALRYVCKYFAKAKNTTSKSRIVFISNNLVKEPIKGRGSVQSILSGYKSIFIQQTSDFTTAYRITDPLEFQRFCNEFLYELYNLPVKNCDLYSFQPG